MRRLFWQIMKLLHLRQSSIDRKYISQYQTYIKYSCFILTRVFQARVFPFLSSQKGFGCLQKNSEQQIIVVHFKN